MNVNFEAIEKVWGKPKKNIIKVNLNLKGIKNLENYITDLEQNRYVLDELEEWLKREGFIMEDGYGYLITEPTDDNKVIYIEDILYKIQELKKENENDK